MRAVVQRVRSASVTVGSEEAYARIEQGLLAYLGIDRDDGETDAAYLVDKLRHLRVFDDASGLLNLDVVQVRASVLVVSAFTVMGDARRGRRPSFAAAAVPERAISLYESFCDMLRRSGVHAQRGSFGKSMMVHSINDGPVCILLESRRTF